MDPHAHESHDGHGHDDHIHPEPTTFLSKYIISFDHKVIAKQFLFLGLFFLLFGGTMAMMIRWQLANPGVPFPVIGKLVFGGDGRVTPAAYTSLFTMHGTIMIFFAITPIMIGAYGNYCIPLMIGARDMVFPTLNMLSFWTMMVSTAVLVGSMFVPMGAGAAGWTAYPPLSTQIGTPGAGQTMLVLSLFLAGASTIMGAVNYITTVIRLRAPGMTYFKMPITVWGLWLTAILNALFVPVLGSGLILLFLDRTFGTKFFIAGALVKGGGDPLLFQHLFWIFGHPEVYILILPVWGVVSDLLSFFARKPAYGYKVTVLALIAVCFLSAVVYGHHMFTTSMSPLLGQGFMVLTMIISVPATVLFINWLGTIWKGSLRLDPPMMFSLGVVFVFGLGGLTGLYLADIPMDLYLHDTYFVVGHFHLTMAAAVFLGSFASIYFWFPKMFGREMNPTLAKLHFWFSFIPINLVFLTMLRIGLAGQQRRLYDAQVYKSFLHLFEANQWASRFAYTLFLGGIFFIINFFYSLVAGKKASENPWGIGTLEWGIPSPPPHHNYDKIPVVLHGPHEFNNPAVQGKDWLGQAEELGGDTAGQSDKADKGKATKSA
ncbi:MAG TPA: cbb3-type cytochrome c oxidase subunit I [Polyangia bacterium]|jgi:cytochrome c oxidase subunit 1|nr:cbb3-type cytochrome c oxidase subunit I [Polyangia bacterium]